MTPAIDQILAAFGGLRSFARALGRTPSTVQYWRERSFPPSGAGDPVDRALVGVGFTRRKAERLVDRAILDGAGLDGAGLDAAGLDAAHEPAGEGAVPT